MLMLVWRDLQYRKWRVLSVTLLMAVVLTLLFLMTGLVGQFRAEPGLATHGVAGDRVWILPEGTGGPFTSAQAIPASTFADADGFEPILVGRGFAESNQVMVIGRNYADRSHPNLSSGRYPAAPGEAVADDTLGVAIGDTIELGDGTVNVVGTASDATVFAGVPLLFVTLQEAQDKLASSEPVAIGALSDQMPQTLPSGLHAMTTDQVAADTLIPLEGAISSVGLTRALLWLVTALVIAAVIYITAIERTRDFAVLKAVGGRGRDLGVSLLLQGIVMTLLATGLAAIIQTIVAPVFPLTIRVPSSAWWQLPLTAVIIATIAGLGGVRKIMATSPAEAFS